MKRRASHFPVEKQGLQQEFEDHTSTVYNGMKHRKTNGVKLGVPFTLEEFRFWLLEGPFRGSWDNAVKCAYCNAWVNSLNFQSDHKIALKYGGSRGLDNINVCCKECNVRKGAMSAEGFLKLIAWGQTNLHPADMSDMLQRMAWGSGYLRLLIDKRKGKGPPPNLPMFEEEEF